MTITRLYDDPEQARPDFRSMAEFHQEVQARCSSSKLELSMGMSADYPIAIEEGATVVRLGTVLFGPRNACHF